MSVFSTSINTLLHIGFQQQHPLQYSGRIQPSTTPLWSPSCIHPSCIMRQRGTVHHCHAWRGNAPKSGRPAPCHAGPRVRRSCAGSAFSRSSASLSRSAEKPECISMTTARATARAEVSEGHKPADGWHSAICSQIAKLSQTVTPSSWSSRAETLQVGECCRSAARLASLPAPASSTQMVSKPPAPSA